MGLQHSYTLIAPIYDLIVKRFFEQARRHSLQRLSAAPQPTLINGIGSGLDLPHLPRGTQAIGIDLTRAMLKRAQPRLTGQISLCQGDAMALPFPNDYFPSMVMHLILAVVPDPVKALQEAERVVAPGGQILIMDKFLPQGKSAPLRRAISPLLGAVATRTDVVFEELLAHCPQLQISHDKPLKLGGWFRHIELRKRTNEPLIN